VIKTFKFKLYNSKSNKILLRQVFIANRIYNHFLALNMRYYKIYKKHLFSYQACKHLTKLKRLEKFKWMRSLPSQSSQDVIERIDRGYKKFFKGLKSGIKTCPPKFKPRSKYRSFTLKQCGYKLLEGNRIRIGNKIFKFFKSRDIEGKVKRLTIKRDQVGDWFLFIVCEVGALVQKPNLETGKRAGFDFGLKTFLTDHNGETEQSPLFLKQSLKSLKNFGKRLSKKKKGSNNRGRAKVRLARLHRRVKNQRRDFHFKLARKLISKYDLIFLEDLNLKGMRKFWGRKISDLGFYSFVVILEYQCLKYGAQLYKIDRWYPSSQVCSSCLKVKKLKLELLERKWECVCGAVHNRDHNAAKNILREGASSLGLCGIKTELAPQPRIPKSSHFGDGSMSIRQEIFL
jgi:putative transposase